MRTPSFRPRGLAASWLWSLSLLGLWACGGERLPQPTETAPIARNAVVVVIDGLDPELLESYLTRPSAQAADRALARWSGVAPGGVDTPELRTGALFRATLPLPGLPDPSAAALLTGLGPAETGVRDARDALPEGAPTLATVVPRALVFGFPQTGGADMNDAGRVDLALAAIGATRGDPPRIVLLRLSGVGDALMARGRGPALQALADADRQLARLLASRFEPSRTVLVVTSGLASADARGEVSALAPGELARRLEVKPDAVVSTGGLVRVADLAPARVGWLALQPSTRVVLRRTATGFEVFDPDLERTRPLRAATETVEGDMPTEVDAVALERLAAWTPEGHWVAVADRAGGHEFRRVGEDPPSRFAGGLGVRESTVPLLFAGPVAPVAQAERTGGGLVRLEEVAPTVLALLGVRVNTQAAPGLVGRVGLVDRLRWPATLPPARVGETPLVFFDQGAPAWVAATRALLGNESAVRERRYNEARALTAESAAQVAARERAVVWGQPLRVTIDTGALVTFGGPPRFEVALDGLSVEEAASRVVAVAHFADGVRALDRGAFAPAEAHLAAASTLPEALQVWSTFLRWAMVRIDTPPTTNVPRPTLQPPGPDALWLQGWMAAVEGLVGAEAVVGRVPGDLPDPATHTGERQGLAQSMRALFAAQGGRPCQPGDPRPAKARAQALLETAAELAQRGAPLLAVPTLWAAHTQAPDADDVPRLTAWMARPGAGLLRRVWAVRFASEAVDARPEDRAALARAAALATLHAAEGLTGPGALERRVALFEALGPGVVERSEALMPEVVAALVAGDAATRSALAGAALSPGRLLAQTLQGDTSARSASRIALEALDAARPNPAGDELQGTLLWAATAAARALEAFGEPGADEAFTALAGPDDQLAALPLAQRAAAEARRDGPDALLRWGPLVHVGVKVLRGLHARTADPAAVVVHGSAAIDALSSWARAEAVAAGAPANVDARLALSGEALKKAFVAASGGDLPAAFQALEAYELSVGAGDPDAVLWAAALGVLAVDALYLAGPEAPGGRAAYARGTRALEGLAGRLSGNGPAAAGPLVGGLAVLAHAAVGSQANLSALGEGDVAARAFEPFIAGLATAPPGTFDGLLAEQLKLLVAPRSGVLARAVRAQTPTERSEALEPFRALLEAQWGRLGDGPGRLARPLLALEGMHLAQATDRPADAARWAERGEQSSAETALQGYLPVWRAFRFRGLLGAGDAAAAAAAAQGSAEACPGVALPGSQLAQAWARSPGAAGERRRLIEDALIGARLRDEGPDLMRLGVRGGQGQSIWNVTLTQALPWFTLVGTGLGTLETGLGATEREAPAGATTDADLGLATSPEVRRTFSMGLLLDAWFSGVESDASAFDGALARLLQAQGAVDPVLVVPWPGTLPPPHIAGVSPTLEPLAWAWVAALAELKGHAELAQALWTVTRAAVKTEPGDVALRDTAGRSAAARLCAEDRVACRAPDAFVAGLGAETARALGAYVEAHLSDVEAPAVRGARAGRTRDPLAGLRAPPAPAPGLCARLLRGEAGVDLEEAGRVCGRGRVWLLAALQAGGDPADDVARAARALSVVSHVALEADPRPALRQRLLAPERRAALRAQRASVRAAAFDAGEPQLALLVDALLVAEDLVAGRAPTVDPVAAELEGRRAGLRGHPAMRFFVRVVHGRPEDAAAAARDLLGPG